MVAFLSCSVIFFADWMLKNYSRVKKLFCLNWIYSVPNPYSLFLFTIEVLCKNGCKGRAAYSCGKIKFEVIKKFNQFFLSKSESFFLLNRQKVCRNNDDEHGCYWYKSFCFVVQTNDRNRKQTNGSAILFFQKTKVHVLLFSTEGKLLFYTICWSDLSN